MSRRNPKGSGETSSSSVTTITPVVTEEHYQKTAYRYLDIARATVAHTSTIAILWLVAIIVCWWSIEQDIEQHNQNAEEVSRSYPEVAGKYKDKQRRDLVNTLRNKELNNECNSDDCVETIFQVSKQKVEQTRSGTIDFQLPTFSPFKVPTRIAPAVLSGIILLLAIYLSLMRERTFRYLGRALRILRGDLKTPMEKIGDVLSPRSWWVPPLPRKSGEIVSSEDFSVALGWCRPEEVSKVLVLLFWMVLFLIQLRLTLSGVSFIEEITRTAVLRAEANLPLERALVGVYWAFLGMTVSLGVRWLWSGHVPDSVLSPKDEIKGSRRRFLLHTGAGLALAILASSQTLHLVRSLTLPHISRHPRFRKQRPFANLLGADGLRLNPRSKVIHLINDGHIVGVRNSRVGKMQPVDNLWSLVNDTGNHIDKSAVSVGTEFASRELLKLNQTELAFQILMQGIKKDIAFKKSAGIIRTDKARRRKPRRRHRLKPRIAKAVASKEKPGVHPLPKPVPVVTVRLYDFVARNSVALNKPKWLMLLLALIKDQGLSDVLGDRVSKWVDPKSKWHRDVAKGVDLLM